MSCSKCDEHRIVYSQKKLSPQEIKNFKSIAACLLDTFSASLQELKDETSTLCKKVFDKTATKVFRQILI